MDRLSKVQQERELRRHDRLGDGGGGQLPGYGVEEPRGSKVPGVVVVVVCGREDGVRA